SSRVVLFVFCIERLVRVRHSFPTRRSSDLNVVGIDIGCGVTIAKLKQKKIEYQKLDTVIRENIPSGYAARKKAHHFKDQIELEEDRKSTRLNSSHVSISYAVFCLKKKTKI